MKEAHDVAVRLRGILGPVVTPFEARTGEVDRAAFEANLRAHFAAGLHGIVVAGSTGEGALLDETERAALVATARPIVPEDRLLIAGVSAESTRAAVRLARQAAEQGADAVLVLAPHYYGESAMTPAALASHYRRVADRSPVPLVLYNIPKYTHFALDPALVCDLAAHENVVGIKDSSGDPKLLGGYLTAQSDNFRVVTGHGASLRTALERGVVGGILAVSLFAPRLALEVYEATQRGDAAAAAHAQERLSPLASQIVGGLGVPGVKAALDAVGLAGGAPRPPLLPLRAADRERVTSWVHAAALSAAA